MASERRVREGFLVIADITGYTSFFTGTELEHAQAIIEELTGLVVRHIRPPLMLVKLEGDGVFYYVPVEAYPEPDRLLDHIEAAYAAFVDHIQFMCAATTCNCAACATMHTLDLKFLAHFGQFIAQRVKGTAEDLAGPDVILVHRLLKNSIESATGLKAYAFLSEACVERIGGPAIPLEHLETYEHIGDVPGRVHDLRAVYEATKAHRTAYVRPGEADVILEHVLTASPELLWGFFIDPGRRVAWQGNTRRVAVTRNSAGRWGANSESHCAHAGYSRTSRALDVRPFHYFTVHSTHRPGWLIPPGDVTFEFTPVDSEHTRVSIRLRVTRRDPLTVFATRRIAPSMLGREFVFARLEQLLDDRGSETAVAGGKLDE